MLNLKEGIIITILLKGSFLRLYLLDLLAIPKKNIQVPKHLTCISALNDGFHSSQ